ncbi:SMI1/KNR4 family protein [Pedobacter sp. AW31-3R]|uniref:SMI1/KNR4 family protein n=1 Tax=Pedobacter sp. AW31-3R TaxID=3445781 RepID=UPI003F9F4F12
MEIQHFWDLTIPATFGPVTSASIIRAETELNVQLPAELIALLKIKNGGRTAKMILQSADSSIWMDGWYEIDELFGINDEDTDKVGILSTAYLTSEWDLPEKQVLILGDGHWWITLDYRTNLQEPTVNWIEPDADRDIVIANNFEEFIKNLVPG